MKRIKARLMMMALAGALTVSVVPMKAYAQVPDNVDMSVIDVEDKGDDEDKADNGGGRPLTPDGNLTIVDDYYQSESETTEAGKSDSDKQQTGENTEKGKQFVTLTTKNGNVFYLIIDRDDSGENTVHFLNLVDERDLMTLLDDDEKKELEKEKEAVKTVKTTTDDSDKENQTDDSKNKTTKKSGKSDALVLCILLGMAGVGGLYFYSNKSSFIKKKTGPIIDDGEEYIEIPSEAADKDYEDVPVE